MRINVHAGHNPDGKVACGAVGLLKESTEARRIKDEVIRQLQALGHTVYDCTVDNGTSQSDVLQKIVAKCNAHTADLDVSIHLNAGAGDKTGNGRTTGTEVYIYDHKSKAQEAAKRVCEKISALGYRNRGVKLRPELYVLNHTKAPAMLVECCFVDDADDVALYNAGQMAKAIAEGITGEGITATSPTQEQPEDAQPAAYSRSRFVADVQFVTGSRVDGKAGPETIGNTITVSQTRNRNHAVVTPLERRLKALGYYSGVIEADEGKTPCFGPGMEAAVKTYQSDHGCISDGEITARQKTWRSLLGMID